MVGARHVMELLLEGIFSVFVSIHSTVPAHFGLSSSLVILLYVIVLYVIMQEWKKVIKYKQEIYFPYRICNWAIYSTMVKAYTLLYGKIRADQDK